MPQSGTITLLFTDLVNSTEHLQLEGDELGDRVFRIHHRLLREAIASAGGQELQWLGDGVLAAFPSVAEAVRCAITIQQTAGKSSSGSKLEIRIGIHLGEVLRRDDGYFGTPVVTARRLCDRAEPGQILCSRIVADLLSSRNAFGFRDLGDLKLKGLAAPLGVCEVIYEHNDPLAMLRHTPFVGRAAELERLVTRFADASNGRGVIAMLRGEPGIGKTRMLEEFADHARQRGAVVLRGACYDGEWQRPYCPFAEAIIEYARDAPEKFTQASGKNVPIVARIAPALTDTITDQSESEVVIDKDEERLRVFDAVSQFLIAVSRQAPLVLILDDLHWADRGTVAILSYCAPFVARNSIFLLGAYRDAEVDRRHPMSRALAGLSRLRNFEYLSLKGLDRSETATFLEIVGDQNAPNALVEALENATDGNPLFIREVLLHLLEDGKILQAGQGWKTSLSIDELGIPEGVRQVIGRRLLRLSDDANRLLGVASAFSGSFSIDVATAVAELDEEAALAAIDEALDAQLLRPGRDADTFDFSHAMIRHTLYAGLNPARRVRLHRKIAEEMEHAWGERAASHAAEVAFQFWRGASVGGGQRGVEYAIEAANNAESACAHDEVAAFLKIALELIAKDDPRQVHLLQRLGLALTWTLDTDEAGKVVIEAAELMARIEGSDRTADFLEHAAREMVRAGKMRNAWEVAKVGLRYIGDRRDITWASLDEIDCFRSDSEAPDNPGIIVDSPRRRERRTVLKRIGTASIKSRRAIDEYPYESRDEIVSDPNCDGLSLLMLAGDCRRGLPFWQQQAAEAERGGRLSLAMDGWAHVARCHNALGEFSHAQASYDRALGLSARMNRPSFPLLNLMSIRFDFLIARGDGWDQIPGVPGFDEFVANAPLEFKFSMAAGFACNAMVMAFNNQVEPALQLLSMLPDALGRGAVWGLNYGMTACDAASALWLINRSDFADVIEESLRSKLLVCDFRFPMRDARLSMARICAVTGRHDEAASWFGKAREVSHEAGWRPLHAIADYVKH
jgi:class 3 adenylate cyclase/tetratricopeptide (TPR) repeat protein